MRNAPNSWGAIIPLLQIQSTSELMSETSHFAPTLVASLHRSGGSIDLNDLARSLRALKIDVPKAPRSSQNYRFRRKAANDTKAVIAHESSDVKGESDNEEREVHAIASGAPYPNAENSGLPREVFNAQNQFMIGDAMAFLAQNVKERKPMFSPPLDHVTSTVGKPPPGPCFACGSKNHWNKECPRWAEYERRTKKEAKVMSSEFTTYDKLYATTYDYLLNVKCSSLYFMSQHVEDSILADYPQGPRTYNSELPEKRFSLLSILWADDLRGSLASSLDQYWEGSQNFGGLTPYCDTDEAVNYSLTGGLPNNDETYAHPAEQTAFNTFTRLEEPMPSIVTSKNVMHRGPFTEVEGVNLPNLENCEIVEVLISRKPPPCSLGLDELTQAHTVKLLPKRTQTPGQAALGISVLSIKGWVGHRRNQLIDLRLDSCADVSLISKDFYDTLQSPPPLRQGLKLKISQLMFKGEPISQYIRAPIITTTEDGRIIETWAELYVIPGMSVPILFRRRLSAVLQNQRESERR